MILIVNITPRKMQMPTFPILMKLIQSKDSFQKKSIKFNNYKLKFWSTNASPTNMKIL